MDLRLELRKYIVLLTLTNACAVLSAQSIPSVCQVDKALQFRNANPPQGLKCQARRGCFSYIQCAFEQDIQESHKGDVNWHEQLVLSLSAVLEQLPHPNPNPRLAEYYREFFATVSLADPTSDRICTEANNQVRHFGPLFRMLQANSTSPQALDGNQESLVENARLQYAHSKCYDKDLLNDVMSPQNENVGNIQRLLAVLLSNQSAGRKSDQSDLTNAGGQR